MDTTLSTKSAIRAPSSWGPRLSAMAIVKSNGDGIVNYAGNIVVIK